MRKSNPQFITLVIFFLDLLTDVKGQMVDISSSVLPMTPGKFGDPCLYPAQCDSNAKLLCMKNQCRCASNQEIYDSVREQCAIRQGERCSPPKFLFGENNPCVSNAVCHESRRVCECEGHAFPDKSGNCVRKKMYNETCSSSRECDDLKYFSCVDGTCACKLSMFDEYHQICRRKIGDDCSRTKECVANAECVNSKCVCNGGYGETSGKTCGLSYGKSCGGKEAGESLECSDIYFACVNGDCRCKNPSYEVFDNFTGTCLSLVGGLCHLFLPSNLNNQPLTLKQCVENAECVRRDLSPLSQCECADGFVETLAGHCRLPQGAVCATPGQSVQECAEPLVCKNMKCECQNENDIYDPTMKICRRIVGSPCSAEGLHNQCVFNSECVSYRCKCSSGFRPTFRGECHPDGYNNNLHLGGIIGPSTGKPISLLNIYDTAPLPHFNFLSHQAHHTDHHNQLLSF